MTSALLQWPMCQQWWSYITSPSMSHTPSGLYYCLARSQSTNGGQLPSNRALRTRLARRFSLLIHNLVKKQYVHTTAIRLPSDVATLNTFSWQQTNGSSTEPAIDGVVINEHDHRAVAWSRWWIPEQDWKHTEWPAPPADMYPAFAEPFFGGMEHNREALLKGQAHWCKSPFQLW